MTSKYVSEVLTIALALALAPPAWAANTLKTDSHEIVAGIVAVAAAVAIIVVVVAVHYSKKQAITGCVVSGANGISITDEKDREVYALSGNTSDIKSGDRIRLRGKKVKSSTADKTPVWEAKEVTQDFGVCRP
jgi:hypothetical protein